MFCRIFMTPFNAFYCVMWTSVMKLELENFWWTCYWQLVHRADVPQCVYIDIYCMCACMLPQLSVTINACISSAVGRCAYTTLGLHNQLRDEQWKVHACSSCFCSSDECLQDSVLTWGTCWNSAGHCLPGTVHYSLGARTCIILCIHGTHASIFTLETLSSCIVSSCGLYIWALEHL